jgi:hypothetical protein
MMFGLGQKQMVVGPGQVPPAGYDYVGSYQDGSGATVDLYQERITAVATAGVPAQPATVAAKQVTITLAGKIYAISETTLVILAVGLGLLLVVVMNR